MQFRDHLPLNCPPEDASSLEIEVYCLVGSDPPTIEDFLSLREKKPNEVFKFDHDLVKVCESCSLSVFTDIEGIVLARKISRTLRNKKLAVGHLSKDSGKIKNTPSQRTGDTHHTWWLNKDIDPCTLFKVLP